MNPPLTSPGRSSPGPCCRGCWPLGFGSRASGGDLLCTSPTCRSSATPSSCGPALTTGGASPWRASLSRISGSSVGDAGARRCLGPGASWRSGGWRCGRPSASCGWRPSRVRAGAVQTSSGWARTLTCCGVAFAPCQTHHAGCTRWRSRAKHSKGPWQALGSAGAFTAGLLGAARSGSSFSPWRGASGGTWPTVRCGRMTEGFRDLRPGRCTRIRAPCSWH
mmetsp:Transcript_76321/g.247153  ORF Transcript_76321/g.247153 Transcript_76321/m.247153 type:complete len:221 (+) Transcript_76321:488-1150(+)